MKHNIKLLLPYVSRYKLQLLIIFCSLSVVALALLEMGLVFRRLIDQGLGSNQQHQINDSIILIIFLIMIFATGSFFRSYFINLLAEKAIAAIKIDAYSNLLKTEIATFEELKIGDIISRLGSDLELASSLITNFLSFFIRNSIMLVGAIILMFQQSLKLSGLVIIAVPIMLVPLLRLGKYVRKSTRYVMSEKSSLSVFLEENLSGIRTLYSFRQQGQSLMRFTDKIAHYLNLSTRRFKLRSLFFALAIWMVAGSIAGVIWIGTLDIANGNMTSGEMISFIYYAIIAGVSAGGIAELFSETAGPMSALERVWELRGDKLLPLKPDAPLAMTQNLNKSSQEAQQEITKQSILTMKNVSFSYPSRPGFLALDRVNLIIKKGKFIGIAGKSGSGKTTIMQLLLGFYQPTSGTISINPNIKIGYAPQEPTIFSGTLKYNISFSRPESSQIELEQVVTLCGIDKIARNLEYGLDTEIGEKGIRLSGGQKQRVAIARALLYNPEILLLDEATSALDNESEKELLTNIRNWMQGSGKTIISIAHRLSSIEAADKIFVIDHGKVVASGTHEELLQNFKLYKSLQKHKDS